MGVGGYPACAASMRAEASRVLPMTGVGEEEADEQAAMEKAPRQHALRSVQAAVGNHPPHMAPWHIWGWLPGGKVLAIAGRRLWWRWRLLWLGCLARM